MAQIFTVHYSSPQAPLVKASLAINDFGPLAIGSMLASVPPTLVVLLLAWVQHRRRRNTSTLAAPLFGTPLGWPPGLGYFVE